MLTNESPSRAGAGNGSALTVVGIIASLVLLGLGFWLLGVAVDATGHELVTFLGGILVVTLGFVVAVHLVPWLDNR